MMRDKQQQIVNEKVSKEMQRMEHCLQELEQKCQTSALSESHLQAVVNEQKHQIKCQKEQLDELAAEND